MKPNHYPRRQTSYPRGFALIVTLSLMILLTVIAVGLLTLSSISLRASSQGNAMSVARANARLAMMIALGDLQTSAGPDQRITAPAGVLGQTTAQQMITGVWKSKKLGPDSTSDDFTKASKSSQFVKWLVSGSDQAALKLDTYPSTAISPGKDVIDLASVSTLDTGAPIVRARKVSIKGGTAAASGRYAYAVLDEGTKARVNLGINSPTSDLAGISTALGSGQRPSLESIPGIGALANSKVDLGTPEGRALVAKMVTVPTAEFGYASNPGKMKLKLHDLTTYSMGVLANVADGGLKKDFNLLAEMQKDANLPAQYVDTTPGDASLANGIYKQAFNTSIVSDPPWGRALAWGGIFTSSSVGKMSVGGTNVPGLTAGSPLTWAAGTGKVSGGGNSPASATLSLSEPQSPVLLPSVAKIQMSFALAARDVYKYPVNLGQPPKDAKGGNPPLHTPWNERFQENLNIPVPAGASRTVIAGLRTFDSPYDYALHLVYSPIITLHNPYNIPLKFTNLRVEFVNVPFSFQVFKNGKPQTTGPVPFAQMYGGTSALGGSSKRFGLTLTDTMLPGEIKVYSPKIDPAQSWLAEVEAKSDSKVFWDYANKNDEDGRTGGTNTDTSQASGIAGWNGPSVGYDLDFLCPGVKQAYPDESVGAARISRWDGIPLKKGDEIYVESTPLPDPALPEKKFSVEMTLNYVPMKKIRSSALIFQFNNINDLQEVMMTNNPQAQNLRVRAPKGTDVWTTEQLFDHSSIPLKNIANTQPFALFSAYAKTTASGSDSEGNEGLWVAKPFSFQNHTSVAITQTVKKGHPSHYSHELALSRFPQLGLGVQDKTFRGKFVTGHTDGKGRTFGSLYEVPLAPLQNFNTLNSAQLAAGTYLPHFSAPVGNSYAHPLLTGSKAIETGAAGYVYADHSFLLNAALFDGYYFSGLQSHATAAKDGDGLTRETLVDRFIQSNDAGSAVRSPLPDQRLKPYFPDGATSKDALASLKGTEAYLKAAAHQMICGAFNVNSISVNAWKAVLSSMTGEKAVALATPDSTSIITTLTRQDLNKVSDAKGARFSRFRIPNGQSDRKSPDGFWRGPTDLTEQQLTALATEIVQQVRTRGPFLSMAEFVNRQLGSPEEKTLAGAIQTAIDKSNLNDDACLASTSNYEIPASKTGNIQLANPKALEGDSAQGAPGFLMQADVLAVLGNTATVRSDTFKIRGYGESLDKSGTVIARACCEVVVQRTPEFVDPQDKATQGIANLTSNANRVFGRRFALISMHWLSPTEI